MRYLILSERDREKFGCPDKLPFEWGRLTNKEVALLPKLGFKSLVEVHRLLRQYADEGLTEDTVRALDAVVWLALRRSGVHLDTVDIEYDVSDMEWFDDDPPPPPAEEDPGKAPGSAAPRKSSPRKAPSSPRTSRRK